MVDRAEFFRVADEIRAEGREPSQRLIRERLARGGSFTDLGRLYVEWATARDFRPRPTREDLPDHFRNRLAALAADIWRDGRDAGAIAARNERDALAVERDKLRLALAETAARADALEEMKAVPAPSVVGAGKAPDLEPAPVHGDRKKPAPKPAPVESTRKGPDSEPAYVEGDDPRAYWNRVMQEVFEWLGDRTLDIGVIFAELPPEITNRAARRDRNWRPGRLAQKMRQKIKSGQLFQEPKEGLFCRRPEAA
jgi:hypothetical protein